MTRNNHVSTVTFELKRNQLKKTHEDRLNRVTANQLRENREIHSRVQDALRTYNQNRKVNG